MTQFTAGLIVPPPAAAAFLFPRPLALFLVSLCAAAMHRVVGLALNEAYFSRMCSCSAEEVRSTIVL